MNALDKRPNTGVPDSLLSPDLILCAGEDSRELMRSLRALGIRHRPRHHHYRCFHFWKFPAYTLALTGIGTGSLEPLIWEMVESGIVQRIILIGTAGYIGEESDRHGTAFLIDKAYLAAAGVSAVDPTVPIAPNFDALDSFEIARAEGIASDYYYGVAKSDDPRILRAQQNDPILAEAMAKVRKEGRLVDMETPQFYRLCEFYGSEKLQYAAIRGVANTQGVWAEQTKYAESVLSQSLKGAIKLLAHSGGNTEVR